MAFISGSRLSQRGSPAKISLYRLKTTVEGKLYISSELVEVLGASSRATLEFRGRLYSVSAYRPSKGSKLSSYTSPGTSWSGAWSLGRRERS